MRSSRIYLKIGIIVLVAIIIISYSLFQAKKILTGAQIIIESPKNGETISSSSVNIKGKIKNATNITLNGRKIFIDENENINEEIFLLPGYNAIKIETEDRFNNKTTKILELIKPATQKVDSAPKKE